MLGLVFLLFFSCRQNSEETIAASINTEENSEPTNSNSEEDGTSTTCSEYVALGNIIFEPTTLYLSYPKDTVGFFIKTIKEVKTESWNIGIGKSILSHGLQSSTTGSFFNNGLYQFRAQVGGVHVNPWLQYYSPPITSPSLPYSRTFFLKKNSLKSPSDECYSHPEYQFVVSFYSDKNAEIIFSSN